MKWNTLLLCLLVCITTWAQPVQKGSGRVRMVITPMFNKQKLQLGNKLYTNTNGDSLYVDAFRFYLSHINIGVLKDDSAVVYHLVDAEDTATLAFYLDNILAGTYNGLQFIVGVDSMANVSGAMGGDLDPTKGMYWAWNTGYIMAKLEGRSTVCKTLYHEFQFHIGGYMAPYSAARTVTLPLPAPLVVSEGETSTIYMAADVDRWFDGIKLAQVNDVVMPSVQSMAIADNYVHMFNIIQPVH